MTTKVHNFRLGDELMTPFNQIAKKLNIPKTTLLKLIIKNFLQNPRIVIEEPEIMTDVPLKFQKKANNIADIIAQKQSKNK